MSYRRIIESLIISAIVTIVPSFAVVGTSPGPNTTGLDGTGTGGTVSSTPPTGSRTPALPSALSATPVSSTQINLSWIDNSSNESGFRIERAASLTGAWAVVATTAPNATAWSNTGLAAGSTWYYRVKSFNVYGDSSPCNTANATTMTSSDVTAPTVPGALVAVPPSCGGVEINWGPATDAGSGLAGYKVYRKNSFVGQVSASTTSFVDTGLPSAAYYYYFISAVDNAGNESAKSTPVGTYTLSCAGNGGEHEWSKRAGGDVYPDDGQAVATDASNNTYVTGDFSMTADFGLGTLTSAGYRDAFVAKYREDGSPVWTKRFGGAYDDFGEGIAVDAAGNVFVTGKFQSNADLGAGLTSAGGYDIFLAKLSGATGQVIWAKRIGGAGADEGASLALDGSGNVFLTGQFFGTVDFGGGAVANASAYVQIFVAKFAGADGAHMWSKRLGKLLATAPTSVGSGRGIAVDPSGNPVITGYFGGPVDFGGGVLQSAGLMDVFVAKYNGIDGRFAWARRFGDAADQHATSVAIDNSGDIVITGDFLGAIDFGAGTLPATQGAQTIFLAKLGASAGASLWARSFVAAGLNVGSYGFSVAIDGANNIVLTGQMSGPVDLGGGPLNNVGGVFAAKYDPSGVHQWSKNFRGGGGQGRGVAIDASDEIVITGAFDTVQDFGGGDLRSGGSTGTDLFLLCLGR